MSRLSLALKRRHKGIYEAENEKIFISLSNPYSANGMGTKGWELIIEDKINEKELLHEWFDTKKQASVFGATWVMANL